VSSACMSLAMVLFPELELPLRNIRLPGFILLPAAGSRAGSSRPSGTDGCVDLVPRQAVTAFCPA
jgi:hypothetical protein